MQTASQDRRVCPAATAATHAAQRRVGCAAHDTRMINSDVFPFKRFLRCVRSFLTTTTTSSQPYFLQSHFQARPIVSRNFLLTVQTTLQMNNYWYDPPFALDARYDADNEIYRSNDEFVEGSSSRPLEYITAASLEEEYEDGAVNNHRYASHLDVHLVGHF